MPRRRTEHGAERKTAHPSRERGANGGLGRVVVRSSAEGGRGNKPGVTKGLTRSQNAEALAGGLVLVLSNHKVVREELSQRLLRAGAEVRVVRSAKDALAHAAEHEIELLIVEEDAPGWAAIVAAWRSRLPAVLSVVVAEKPTLEGARAAMRSGACEYVSRKENELVDAALAALGRARVLRLAQRSGDQSPDRAEMQRLREENQRLARSREEVMGQLAGLCTSLASSCSQLNQHVQQVGAASEFNALVRQELGLEGLLRTTLEYLLKRTGPTNAAVFMPASSGDYSLGAYINYDCPRDGAEAMIDSLCNAIAPAYEDEPGVHLVARAGDDQESLGEAIGPGAAWLEDSTMLIVPCIEDGECLAVMTLFRDHRTPFDAEACEAVGLIAEIMGKQLARVVRTHNRHKPEELEGGDELE